MNSLKLKLDDNDSCLCVDANDNILATSTEKGRIVYADAKLISEPIGTTMVSSDQEVPSVCIGKRNPNLIYSASGNTIFLYDFRKFTDPLLQYTFNSDEINQIVLSNCEQYLFSADDSGYIKMINVERNQLESSIQAHDESSCFTLKVRPNSNTGLISGGYDCKVCVWDIEKKRRLQQLNVINLQNEGLPCINPPYVLSVDFSSNGSLIAAGLQNGTLYLWKTKNSRFKKFHVVQDAHSTLGTTQVHFFCSSPSFVTGGNDGAIKFWNWRKSLDAPVKTINHGHKINWFTSHHDSLFVCDTSPFLTVYNKVLH